jgi:predicted  nucleic acid-binding Zn-ribbon protein
MDARKETQQLQHHISTIKASEANTDNELRELEKNYYEKTAQLEDELVRLAVEKAVGAYLEIALIEVHVN